MRARCRISTNGKLLQSLTFAPTSLFLWPALKFLTDSTRLIGVKASDIRRQKPLVRTFLVNGLERAFTKMPANLKTFHPEAARREL
jgi:hypothetical protein